MKGMTKFQLILTAVFGAFIVIGVLLFAFGQSSNSGQSARITVWGTMSSALFSEYLKVAGLDQDKLLSIEYEEKRRETFDQDFVEALAVGAGPDLIFLPHDSILKHEDKIYTIPYDSYPERTFKDIFIEEGELYLTKDGVIGVPFIVDPLVMYWNRDLFSNEGLGTPPRYWSELYDLATKLTKKDPSFNVSKSAFALGEYNNITNANEIISLLVMQAGNPITVRNPGDGLVSSVFNSSANMPVSPADLALNFYTEFSNPLKPFYSWNRSLQESKKQFLAGDLALYFGFASELADIRLKNPNLNFDIASIPQSKDAQRLTTYGRMVGFAIPKASKNVAAAFRAITLLTAPASLEGLSLITNLPPVRRDLLANKPTEAYKTVFYNSAIQARAWLSPEPSKLSPIFKEMVESITAGRSTVSQVVTRAHQQLQSALP